MRRGDSSTPSDIARAAAVRRFTTVFWLSAILMLALPGVAFLLLQGLGPTMIGLSARGSFIHVWDNLLLESSVAAEWTHLTTPAAIALALAGHKYFSGPAKAAAWTICGLALCGTLWHWGMMLLIGF